jgi:hypothetical protein
MMSTASAIDFYLERGSTFDRQPHRPSTGAALLAHPPMRQFKDPTDEFLNRWDLLGLDG